ncbi:MAG TPA: hypothetical protein DEF85_04495, partial [Clostridiaceae bacterium]|jgi:hypothetical protein|nr:hypothetical protein [Clostridiaceae bacterium]
MDQNDLNYDEIIEDTCDEENIGDISSNGLPSSEYGGYHHCEKSCSKNCGLIKIKCKTVKININCCSR